jgi:hypothetical protein
MGTAGMSQIQQFMPIGKSVRFQAIGRRAEMTDIRVALLTSPKAFQKFQYRALGTS